jgi:class 3 adenylate cyclase/tetratricopeptide (TPR) repeat protein
MRYLFSDYTLDVACRELCYRGYQVPLRPKVFDLLAYLIVHRDQAVTKQTLLTQLWPHVHVSPATLSACIKLARRAVGDSGAAQQVIQTLHGHGYRFLAPVDEGEPTVPTALQLEERPRAPVSALEPAHTSARPMGDVQPVSTACVRPAADGEYKPVTVLCCGVADLSSMAGDRASESLYRRMQTRYGLIQEVLGHYVGTLLHHTSTGFTAVFGAPMAQEDHARRAVHAALALQQRLHASPISHAATPAGGLLARMGLHSGSGVVGVLGQPPSHSYTVVGEPAILATHLQQHAAPGTILLSAATYRLVHEEVEVASDCSSACDGTSMSMPVYVLVQCLRRETDMARSRLRVRAPLVGRERELTLLYERLDAACAGQGQVVSLIGEPGIGKTRLLTAFCHGLQERQVPYYSGQCLAYGQTIPYHLVRDLLRQLCPIAAGHETESSSAAVCQWLQTMEVVAAADIALVLQVLDFPIMPEALASFHPQARQARTFALLRHLILRLAQPRPLVLTVENLQWSDALSAAWLASLVEQLADATLLLVVTYRPGYRPPWEPHATTTQVVLPPLGTRESWSVVQALQESTPLPPAILQEIVTRAAGNPFFLEELIWHTTAAGTSAPRVAMPATIHAVLAARLDQLPLDAKALLQTAAVLGTTFPLSLLRRLAEVPETTLQQGILHLQAMGFLCETRVVPEGIYAFKHALTHEVAYGSLLQERRRALHARILDVLATGDVDQPGARVEELAHHAVQSERWSQALTYVWQAGTKAFTHAAYREAVTWFEQALRVLQQLPEDRDSQTHAIALCLDLRHALVRLGDWEAHQRVLDVLCEAERLAKAAGMQRQLAQITGYLANHFQWRGDYAQALTAGQRARGLAEALDERALQSLAHAELGPIYFSMGDYRQAQVVLEHSIRTLSDPHGEERLGHATLLSVHPHAWLLMCLAQMGHFAAGRPLSLEAIRIAEASQAPYSLAMAYQGAGVLALRQGDFPQAIATLERGLAICRARHIESWFAGLAAALGYAYALTGHLAEALQLLEQVVVQDAAMRGGQPLSTWVLWQSEAILLTGRAEEAWLLTQQALTLARTRHERGNEAWALWLLGEIAQQRAPLDTRHTATHYGQALVLAAVLGMRPLQAHCLRGLGTLYAATGQQAQARTALATAIAMYQEMEMTFWLPQSEATLEQVYLTSP